MREHVLLRRHHPEEQLREAGAGRSRAWRSWADGSERRGRCAASRYAASRYVESHDGKPRVGDSLPAPPGAAPVEHVRRLAAGHQVLAVEDHRRHRRDAAIAPLRFLGPDRIGIAAGCQHFARPRLVQAGVGRRARQHLGVARVQVVVVIDRQQAPSARPAGRDPAARPNAAADARRRCCRSGCRRPCASACRRPPRAR